ncbi:hypothetical protein ACFO25_14220 [Paenactinomyces guangxiensis]|uniref:Uncharacterized protein n=1 Tax=Paenactinomyces guangxiensis TaxID=1490290 RepID=A0A7W1WQB9_9BACL|nr:hypothetical protein [Paenactinomyces guangxiensis]MBA4493979.1 hypothetical protein [Paenactinomyces guangxiensis]MBH8593400.1 hypothetical protein [Paenactinomyces guangxiensis]
MKPRTLGFGFLSLFIYLLGIYSLSLAFMFLKSKPPYGFNIRLAFLPADFNALLGVQILALIYFVISLVLIFNPKKDTVSSTTSIGFWALSSSTFLFGIKYLILVLAFLISPQSKMTGFLYNVDWMYYVFEWMMDILFWGAVILFLMRLIMMVKKKQSSS